MDFRGNPLYQATKRHLTDKRSKTMKNVIKKRRLTLSFTLSVNRSHRPFTRMLWMLTGPKSQMNITKQFICLTYNITYVIHCTKCAQLYISETGRILDTRFKEHAADIKHRSDKPVANHLNQTGQTIHNIRVKGPWLLFTDSVNDRKDMESHLIDKLGSSKPGGMNERQ